MIFATKEPTDVPVNEAPAVLECRERLRPINAEFEAAQAEVSRINALISPYAFLARQGMDHDPIATAEAHALLPEANKRLALTTAQKLRAEEDLKAAMKQARRDLELAREPGRTTLLNRLLDQADELAAMAQELSRYDEESQMLGLGQREVPLPHFVRDRNGETHIDFLRRRYGLPR